MGTGIALVGALVLTGSGALLLVVGRRRDTRHRATAPAADRSTSGIAIVVPLVIVGFAIAALIESTSATRLHIGLLGLAAVPCAIGGSHYVLRYAKRTLQRQQGQPWTYDRVASAILWLLASGLVLTALSVANAT